MNEGRSTATPIVLLHVEIYVGIIHAENLSDIWVFQHGRAENLIWSAEKNNWFGICSKGKSNLVSSCAKSIWRVTGRIVFEGLGEVVTIRRYDRYPSFLHARGRTKGRWAVEFVTLLVSTVGSKLAMWLSVARYRPKLLTPPIYNGKQSSRGSSGHGRQRLCH